MPLWIVSTAGAASSTHWNQPPSSSRFTRTRPPSTLTSMMIVACGRPSRAASATPVCACPWSSDCRPVRIRSKPFVAHRRREDVGDRRGVRRPERVVLDVDRAVGAARQRLLDHLRDARRPRRADDDFAAVRLAKAQPLFERVGVGLVQLPGRVLLADVRLVVREPRLPLAGRDLFDADGDFHGLRVIRDRRDQGSGDSWRIGMVRGQASSMR